MSKILEDENLQDFRFGEDWEDDNDEVEKYLKLHQMKNEMFNKAFNMRRNNVTISQEEADELNKILDDIINQLVGYNYEPMLDYIVNFNSFVVDNEHYKNFCW